MWRYGVREESLMPYVPRNEPLGAPSAAAPREGESRTRIEVDTIPHWTAPIGFGDEQA